MCICPDGARGKNCEELYGICKTGVCGANGDCMDLADNSYKCVCKEGYTGPFCETKLDACEPHPCKNDGVCESRSSSYTCRCKPGKTRIHSLKDKSGVDKIIVKKQPYQLLNTSREFFPSFHASNFQKFDDYAS